MPLRYRITKLSLLLELCLDAALAVLFGLQAFLLGCLLTYGYIPLPTEWANEQLKKYPIDSIYLQSDQIGFDLSGGIRLSNIEIFRSGIRCLLYTSDAADE